jgi:hypothetical protein
VLLNNSNLPITILDILLEQRLKRIAGRVPTSDSRGVPNLPTSFCKAKIELVVLVARQFLVEQPDSIKYLAAIHTTKDCISRTVVIGVVPTGSPDGERAMMSDSDSLL